MTMDSLPEIFFLNDLDGVWFNGPRPQGTLKQLRKGELKLPPENVENPPFTPKHGLFHIVARKVELMHHARRGLISESLMGLAQFREAAEENGRKLVALAVSGREVDKHAMTHTAFKRFGITGQFDGGIFLNDGGSAYIHKEKIAEGIRGVILHIDDDIRANFCVARKHNLDIGRNVLSYCLDRRGYIQGLLNDSPQIDVPGNVVIVHSFVDAAVDFRERLASGQI